MKYKWVIFKSIDYYVVRNGDSGVWLCKDMAIYNSSEILSTTDEYKVSYYEYKSEEEAQEYIDLYYLSQCKSLDDIIELI